MFQCFKQYTVTKGKASISKNSANTIMVIVSYVAMETEAYYTRECLLRIPWRDMKAIKPEGTSWKDLFNNLPALYKLNLNLDIEKFKTEKDDSDMGQFEPEFKPEINKNVKDYLELLKSNKISYENLLKEDLFNFYPDYDWQTNSHCVLDEELNKFNVELNCGEISLRR